MSLRWSPYGRR